MDTGKRNDNYTYYNGYEGETEFILSSGNDSIHIWEGYIEDIFGTPALDGKGWKGLTRDYNEMSGPFDGTGDGLVIDAKEYLEDALTYRGYKVEYKETPDVLESMIRWLMDHGDAEVIAKLN